MKPIIETEELTKRFQVRESCLGLWGKIKGLVSSVKIPLEAIDCLNLTVYKGEKIAFIGPNGAGKSTTIKILTGILYPTSGKARVLGFVPWKDRRLLGYHIGTVFGQRTQLWYHLPPLDTFNLLAKIYELDLSFYKQQLEELLALFEIESFLDRPVRQLSLGQRMRCELVASLLHNPKILFLDEPTIGLDLNAKLKIREFLNSVVKKRGTTLFLTSHDTADIEHICERVVVLDKGRILRDCSLKELKSSFIRKKQLKIMLDEKKDSIDISGLKLIKKGDYQFICEIDRAETTIEKVIYQLSKISNLKDITIEDPSMDSIIRAIYASSK